MKRKSIQPIRAVVLAVLVFLAGMGLALAQSGTVTRITDNNLADIYTSINNHGDMVWMGQPSIYYYQYQIFRLKAGESTPTNISNNADSNYYPRISDQGDVVWYAYGSSGSQVYRLKAGESTPTIISNTSIHNYNPEINNNGDVVWYGYSSYRYQIYLLKAGETVPLQLSSSGINSYKPAINDNGDVVWYGYGSEGTQIYRLKAGESTPVNLSNSPSYIYNYDPQISNNGDVVWYTYDYYSYSGYQVLRLKAGASTPENISGNSRYNSAPRINGNGDVVWYATGYQGSYYYRVLMVPSDSSTPVNLFSSSNNDATPDINDNGDIVFIRQDPDWEVFLYHGVPSNQPPAADAGPDATVEANIAGGAAVALNGSGSSDPDGDALSYAWQGAFGAADGVSPTVNLPLGENLITLTVMDPDGESASDDVVITVVDTTPPTLAAPGDFTAEANGNPGSLVDLGTATVSDFFPVTVSNDAPPSFPLGTTLVTWSAMDTSGNTSTDLQLVTVVDTTPPVLTVPDDVSVIAGGDSTAVAIGSATATDLFAVTITNDAPAGGFPVGTTVVTWTAADANGNVATGTQTVSVRYTFEGFLSPLKEGGVYKQGRVIPVKFRLAYADGSPVTNATATMQLQRFSGSEPSGDPIDATSVSAADSGNTFRYADDHYIFNLSTKMFSSGSYQIQVDIGDDSDPKTIQVGFK